MRDLRLLAILLSVFAVGACDDDGGATDLAPATDLAVPADLTAVDLRGGPSDGMSAGCAATLGCIQGCTAATMNVCVPACLAELRAASRTIFDALQACAQPACYDPVGGAPPPPCQNPSSAGCQACITSSCGAQLTACSAD